MAHDMSVLDFERPIVDLEKKIEVLRAVTQKGSLDVSGQIAELVQECDEMKKQVYGSLTPWQRVQLARHPKRPYTGDYIKQIFTDFIELHGDRAFADDRALVCGIAELDGMPVAVIGQQKGRNIQENMERNFGMAHPEGYRKALKVMKLAEKFGRPIITFIDTPGAYPGIGAEERGQSEAIAKNLRDMSVLKVPVVSVVIGEGGSGGALGIGIANRVLMFENSYYSVITPEGCAAILFRDAAKAAEAAEALPITAKDLLELGIIEEIIAEPLGGAHRDPQASAANLKAALLKHLGELSKLSERELQDGRYAKFRSLGRFSEGSGVKEKTTKRPRAKHKPGTAGQ